MRTKRQLKSIPLSTLIVVAGSFCIGIAILIGLVTMVSLVKSQYTMPVPSKGPEPFVYFVYSQEPTLFLKYSLIWLVAGGIVIVCGCVARSRERRHYGSG
jgi:hypothetical protein